MKLDWGAVAFFLAAFALFVFFVARGVRRQTGLPRGRVVYSDTSGSKPLQPLFASHLKLTGRPDYLINQGRDVIPVEVKSRTAPYTPYASHVLQLAAYCALVEATYHRRPPYGILRYADRSFEIPFTKSLEARLAETLAWMSEDLEAGDAPRDHDEVQRCRACPFRESCPDALA